MIPFVLDFRSDEMAAAALKILPPDLWASEPCRAERSASHPWSLILGVPDSACIEGISIPDDSVFAAIQRLVIWTGAEWIDELLPLSDLPIQQWAPPLPAAMIDGIFGVSRGVARLMGLVTVEHYADDPALPIPVCGLGNRRWTRCTD